MHSLLCWGQMTPPKYGAQINENVEKLNLKIEKTLRQFFQNTQKLAEMRGLEIQTKCIF